jgi:formylglycine-generating enzyme required for sulfatase activity
MRSPAVSITSDGAQPGRRAHGRLRDGLDNLAGHNLLTYKSLREPLDDWALQELTGHYVNYRKQASPRTGLHEVAGNAWEWVADCWHSDYQDAPFDGRAWLGEDGGDCARRVVRGGGWFYSPRDLRSAFRNWNDPDAAFYSVGFRLARTL